MTITREVRIKDVADLIGMPYETAVALATTGDFPPRPFVLPGGGVLISKKAYQQLKTLVYGEREHDGNADRRKRERAGSVPGAEAPDGHVAHE